MHVTSTQTYRSAKATPDSLKRRYNLRESASQATLAAQNSNVPSANNYSTKTKVPRLNLNLAGTASFNQPAEEEEQAHVN